jgi:hypothetical protein
MKKMTQIRSAPHMYIDYICKYFYDIIGILFLLQNRLCYLCFVLYMKVRMLHTFVILDEYLGRNYIQSVIRSTSDWYLGSQSLINHAKRLVKINQFLHFYWLNVFDGSALVINQAKRLVNINQFLHFYWLNVFDGSALVINQARVGRTNFNIFHRHHKTVFGRNISRRHCFSLTRRVKFSSIAKSSCS